MRIVRGMDVSAIRHELSFGDTPSLRRRRWIARLAAVGAIDSVVVGLAQMRAIKRLPDLPFEGFDANEVTHSKAAYVFGAPDATLATMLFGAQLVLASAFGTRRSGRKPWMSKLLWLAVAGGAVGSAGYLVDMALVEKKACPYCFVSAAVSFAMLPFAWRELKARDRT